MIRHRILCLAFSDLETEPRAHRQLRLLQENHSVTAAGYVDPQIEGVEFIPLRGQMKSLGQRLLAAARLKTGRFHDYYWAVAQIRQAFTALQNRSFDLIIANDDDTWPLALAIRGQARVIFDAPEYSPLEYPDVWWWRFFYQRFKDWTCRQYLPSADAVITVCSGIAKEYETQYGVKPLVVRNIPAAFPWSPLAAKEGAIRMIHHGNIAPSRKIENMILLMDHLDERFSLDLMLVDSGSRYFNWLRQLARSRPRIRFLPPVPMPHIVRTIQNYDIGLYLLEPTNFNHLHMLPNKFFEFIQARLAIAIGPSPEMAELVRKYDCGVVAEDFSPRTLAASLRTITAAQIAQWKGNSNQAASELSWEREGLVLLHEVERLLALGSIAPR